MNIKPEDIAEITVVGTLNDEDVKIIKTTGGFHIAVGRRNKGNEPTTVLGGGSHKGLVVHHVQKDYPDFQQNIFKSEKKTITNIEDKTKFLSDINKNKGIELFLCKSEEGNKELVFSKYGVVLAKYEIKGNKVENTFTNKNAKK